MTLLKATFSVLISMMFFSGCYSSYVGVQRTGGPQQTSQYHKQGPPPHAPAHGYRHKNHDGRELEYDDGLGAYIVVNVPETYFGNNLYIRLSSSGQWMVSAHLDDGWRVAAGYEVPYKLKAAKEKKDKKKTKHKKEKDKGSKNH